MSQVVNLLTLILFLFNAACLFLSKLLYYIMLVRLILSSTLLHLLTFFYTYVNLLGI